MDILGEHTSDAKLSQKITKDYCSLYNLITQKSLDCTISLKLTHLGLDISEELAVENLNKIIESAKPGNRGLTIDMENSPYTSQTLAFYKTALKSYEKIGTVLQSYLHRSMDDLKLIMSPKLRLRICKGIYLEDEKIAFQNGNKINENYIALCQTLLEGEGFAEIATHDTELIHKLDRWITENQIPMDRFEFQVLYGVPMGNTLENLKDKGYRVRVYIPFGDKWYEGGSLDVKFTNITWPGDEVTARGVITDNLAPDGTGRSEVNVWMEKEDGTVTIVGNAYIPHGSD